VSSLNPSNKNKDPFLKDEEVLSFDSCPSPRPHIAKEILSKLQHTSKASINSFEEPLDQSFPSSGNQIQAQNLLLEKRFFLKQIQNLFQNQIRTVLAKYQFISS
jgi:hypothetical protein